MSDLHNKIMNIPAVPPKDANINQILSYKIGHRDARHAAAELTLAALTSVPAEAASTEGGGAVALDRSALIDLIEERLYAVYHCTRVWEAWSVGTMTEDDFTEARGTDLAPDIADAVMAKLATPSAAAPRKEALTEAQIDKAAKAMAACMDYPWEHMPEQGRNNMRKHAKAVIEAVMEAA